MCRPTVGRVELWSRRLLLTLYQLARGLSLLSSRLQLQANQVQLKAPRRQYIRWLIILWRTILVNAYWSAIPGLLNRVRAVHSYADLFAVLQSTSVILFAVGSFIVQVRAEARFMAILNRYIRLYGRICALTHTQELFSLKFPIFYALKLILTVCGCLYELPQLLPWRLIDKLDMLCVLTGILGIYMWLGTLFMLDTCFLGFLVSGVFYEHMGMHIATMLQDMQSIDIEYIEEQEQHHVAATPQHLSDFQRMCLLCDRADELEACGVIYNELYNVTISFRSIFQWQILFYIYYNFVVLLLMLYAYILNYLEIAKSDMVPMIMISIKLSNIVLLVMCADYMIKKSQLPQLLPLDIVCTDIDERWDKSVENILSQLQTQQLEIRVLGILQLNNRFIPTILSAIITYLFILIQFGFTGAFDEASKIVKHNLNPY